jgi:hypothetical protein
MATKSSSNIGLHKTRQTLRKRSKFEAKHFRFVDIREESINRGTQFSIIELIGQGAYEKVLKAHEKTTGATAAIKSNDCIGGHNCYR